MTAEAAEHELVILGLVFLGVVVPAGMLGMEVGHTLCAVFAVAQGALGEAQVEEANPQVIQEAAGHIPAQVQVPADHIGDVCRPIEGAAHGIAGQGGEAGGIHLVIQVVDDVVIVQHILFVLGGDGNLVGHAPAHDAGVVVVLLHQLFGLADGILPTVGHMLADIGNLCPHHHAVAVAQVIEVLVVLIVGKPHGIAAHFRNQCHILVMHLAGNGIAQTLAVLVTADTVEGIGLFVEEEALLGVNPEGADTEGDVQIVQHLAVFYQAALSGVEIGVCHTVPAVGIFNDHGGIGAFAGGNGLARSVYQGNLHLAAGGAAFHPDGCLVAVGSSGDPDAAGAEIIKVEMRFGDDNQLHVPVNAAVEGEVRLLGVDAVIFGVVHGHFQLVNVLQKLGNLTAEGGIAAVVGADLGAVESHSCGSVDTGKIQVNAFLRTKGGKGEVFPVNASTSPVVVATVLAIQVIPGVGKVYWENGVVVVLELPVFVDAKLFSHDDLLMLILHSIGAGGLRVPIKISCLYR